jgi:prohibitin 2
MRGWSFGFFAVVILFGFIFLSSCFYVIQPGERGVLVTLGKADPVVKTEGVGFKAPLISSVQRISIRQQTQEATAPCFSSDLQQVNLKVQVLYSIPESSVVKIYQDYLGDPFQALIAPRVQEAIKEQTAMMSAEQIVKNREKVKAQSLEAARHKIGSILVVADLVIENVDLSNELEHAIEAKMVQEQEAAKAKFVQQKTEIEAQTAIIKAKGEAEAIRVRAEGLSKNREIIELLIVEKWDGKTPQVVGAGVSGANMLLPIK